MNPEQILHDERARQLNNEREAAGHIDWQPPSDVPPTKPISQMSDAEFIEYDATRTAERKLRQRIIRETR